MTERKCVECGAVFMPRYYNETTCSNNCKRKHKKTLFRLWYAEHPKIPRVKSCIVCGAPFTHRSALACDAWCRDIAKRRFQYEYRNGHAHENSQYQKSYRYTNRETLIRKKREYYRKLVAAGKRPSLERYRKNPHKRRLESMKYYYAHHEECKEKLRAYHLNHPFGINELLSKAIGQQRVQRLKNLWAIKKQIRSKA